MASSSSIDTPLVVEGKDRNCPVFKKHPYKSMEDDPVGDFSFVPHGVLHFDDKWVYIHCEIEETGTQDILDLYTHNIMEEIGSPKPEYMQLQRKGFT